jgi:hypothetical protein
MQSRTVILSLTILAATSGLYAVDRPNSYVGAASVFSIGKKTDVPGKTLVPGEYSIIVADQFSDRVIVKLQNETTKDSAIFLGVPQPELGEAPARGPVVWKAGPGGTPALRGYAFSPGSKVEFVYPKDEAVEIATRNAEKVIAVDPASEGLPPVKNMSKDDMRMVNLWALALTTVGPNDKKPAIAAKRYEGVQTTQPPALAKNAPAAPQQQNVAKLEQPNLGGQSGDGAATSSAKRRPVIAKLPHTGSPVALIAFFGICCLMTGVLLRVGSIVATQKAYNR